jgi:glycosyltransferase involved in cell wall biosynthesis
MALFLELGGSFEEWNRVGFFSREISLYNRLARDFFGTIYIFTYGSEKDLLFSKSLEKNIVLIPRKHCSKNYFVNSLYEIVIPLRHRSILKKCDILKTNQNSGSIAAAITKICFPKCKLIIRSGYIGTELDWNTLSLAAKAYYIIAENFSYRICDGILIPKRDAAILSDKYPFTRKKITVLNNFIDTDRFAPLPQKQKYDIIYVARLSETKNHIALLKAIVGTDVRLLFIGQGENYSMLADFAKKMSLDVTIIDSVSNNQLPAYYNASGLCVFPSLQEGNPKALLEAMACGLPIVALDSPGITNIIINEKNGLIGPEKTLKENIARLLSNPTLRDTLGRVGRQDVVDKYAFEKIVTTEIGTYRKLLES